MRPEVIKPRRALNNLIRGKAGEIAEIFCTEKDSELYSDIIRRLWESLYDMYLSATGLDIKEASESRGYDNTLEYAERIGVINKLHELAQAMFF